MNVIFRVFHRHAPAARWFSSLLALVLVASALAAQSSLGTSSVSGVVRDSSSFVVPKATVRLTDAQHGTTRVTTSNSEGEYQFPGVLPSIYTVTVEREGFGTTRVQNVRVVIDQRATVNVSLKAGGVSQAVTVNGEGETPLLDTSSNELGTVIDNARVENLPLNGRNFLQLGYLVGGSQQPTGSSDEVSNQTGHTNLTISLTGANQFETTYLIDGIATRASRIGNLSLNLSVAAIDQFKVEEGFFMPDEGPNPGIVDVITKPGTNKFHGEVFEFVRNTDFDARNYFNRDPSQADVLHRNQFGFALGGPVFVPKLFNGHDKLWFQFSYEGTRQVDKFVANGTTPTADMLNGNFSALGQNIYDPSTYNPVTGTRSQFSGNVIPTDRINPVAQKLLAYYLPCTDCNHLISTTSNISGHPRHTFNDDKFTVRGDWSISARQSMFVTVAHENSPVVNAGLMPLSGGSFPMSADLAAVQHTFTFSPRMINILRIGYDRDAVLDTSEGQGGPPIETTIGIPGTVDPNGVPGVALQGYTSFGNSAGPLGDTDNSYQLDEALTYWRGTHNLAFGTGINYHRSKQQNSNANAVGSLSFQPIYTAQLMAGASGPTQVKSTGNSVADFLLGMPLSGTVVGFQPMHYRFTEYYPYIQDSWRWKPNFTINYGISWYLGQIPNPHGADAKIPHAFDFTTGLLQYAALGQVSPQVIHTDYNNFTPRVGFAWMPGFLHNTVVKAGAGIYYGQLGLIEAQFSALAPPFQNSVSFSNSALATLPTYTFGNPNPQDNVFPVIPLAPLDNSFAANLPSGFAPFAANPKSVTPITEMWNFSLQHTIGRSDLVEASYIGDSAHHQQNRYDADQCYVDPTLFCNNSIRPYPRYKYILFSDTNGNVSYEGLLMKYQHQFSRGLSVLASYTFSKTLSDSWETEASTLSQVAACRSCDKGPVSYDIPQSFVVSALYDLPFGRGRQFGRAMPRAADIIVGGWRLSTIGNLATGSAFTVTAPNTTPASFVQVRAIRLCNGKDTNLSKHLRSNGYADFDAKCFAAPATGHFGTSPRGVLFGPGTDHWDTSLSKQIPLVERMTLHFQADFFNVFNHANFGLPGNSVTGANYATVATAADPRQIQLAARITW